MPVYAYKCKSCGHQLEVRQSFSDAPLSECPQCGGELRKQFNSVGVVFKGSGFYSTDSATSGASTPSGTSTASSAESSSSSSGESTPSGAASGSSSTQPAAAAS